MGLSSSAGQIISALLVFLLGFAVVVSVGRGLLASSARSSMIYCWHTLMCLFYCWYVQNYGGDAIAYFLKSSSGFVAPGFGTAGVIFLTSLLVSGLGLSFLGSFLVFNVFGAIGLLAFDACLRIATGAVGGNLARLSILIVFLPSVSFWSSAIGKDAISFMATGLAMWAAMNLSRRSLLMAIAVVAMLLVRPHMAGMMIMALVVTGLFDSTVSTGKKMILAVIAAGVGVWLIPFALNYAGVGRSADMDGLVSYIEVRQAYNMSGGGAVDIGSMNLPMKLVTYLFRPLIFEARSIFSFAASIDNLILLCLFIVGGYALCKRVNGTARESRLFMWTYSLLALLVLATTTANLGIALRQKWMFVPMLIFLLVSAISRLKSSENVHDSTGNELDGHDAHNSWKVRCS